MKRYDPPISPSPTDCAYAAGFVDGEGHILVSLGGLAPDTGSPRFIATVGVTQQDRRPLEWMRERWGGGIFPHASGYSTRPCWRIQILGRQAAQLCEDILPFLQVKTDQAANLVAFVNCRPMRGTKGQRITPEKIALYQGFADRSKDLNKRGTA